MTVFTIYYDLSKLTITENIWDFLHQSHSPIHIPVFYANQIRSMLRSMINEQKNKPAGYKLVLAEKFSLTFMSIYRAVLKSGKDSNSPKNPPSTQRAAEVLNYTKENYFDSHSLSSAAKIANLSQRQFTNICRKQTGKSFIQYLNSIRTQKAKQLLISTNMPVSAIAFEVGYEELSTFYRAFRKYQKTAPKSLRQ
jgi:AraC-like DNA-binding protein